MVLHITEPKHMEKSKSNFNKPNRHQNHKKEPNNY